MPIYEYQCSKCGEIFEAFQKISDEPLSECKFCHARVEKLISQSSFQLKGSGWYLTDYANRSSSNSTGDKPKTTDGSNSSTETKAGTETKAASETKSAAKSSEGTT